MQRATKKVLKDKNLHVGMIMLLSNLYRAAGEPVGGSMHGGENTQAIDWTWIAFVVCAGLGALGTMKWLWDYTKDIFLGMVWNYVAKAMATETWTMRTTRVEKRSASRRMLTGV